MMEFRNEYLNEYWDTPAERKLKDLALRYHEETDAYDHLLCAGQRNPLLAFSDGYTRRLMVQNAKSVFDRLSREAAALGFDRQQWTAAIQSTDDRRERRHQS